MGQGPVQYAFMIGKETTWGNAVTADKDIGIVTDVGANPSREGIIAAGISAIDTHSNYVGTQEGAHTVTMEFHTGRMFEFIVGEASHVETTSDWVHTFTVDNEPKSYTAETGDNISGGDVGLRLTGSRVESAELSIALNELLLLSVTSRGKFPTVLSTVPAQTVSTLPAFPASQVTVSLNATPATEVQNFSVTFTKVLEPVFGTGDNDALNMVALELRIEFSGTLAYSDTTFHDHFVNNDVTAITFVADNGVALGSGKRALELALNDIEMLTFDVSESMGGLTFVDVGGIAKINTFTTTDSISSAAWF